MIGYHIFSNRSRGFYDIIFVKLLFLFERSLYSRAALIHFFSHCSALVNPLHCIRIYLKLHEVFGAAFIPFSSQTVTTGCKRDDLSIFNQLQKYSYKQLLLFRQTERS